MIMLRYMADPANLITSAGIMFASLGLFLAFAGHMELAIASVLWSMLADQLDGIVARRTKNRSPECGQIGKQMDGFADLIYGAAFPAVVILLIGQSSLLSLCTATVLLLAGSIRLSYFANFGLSDDGRFLGLPLSYDVPLLAALFLLKPWFPAHQFAGIVTMVFLTVAALHVAPIRVQSPGRFMYMAIVLFSTVASMSLIILHVLRN